MTTPEQPAIPFYENTDLGDAHFPWMTFEEAADRVYLPDENSLDAMKQSSMDPIRPHEIGMDARIAEKAFAQKVLAFVKECDRISWDFVDDSEKYHAVRHSMALRVIGLYFDTQHYLDALSELGQLRRELAITPGDPIIPFVHSAYRSVGSIHSRHSEPLKDISYMQLSMLDE